MWWHYLVYLGTALSVLCLAAHAWARLASKDGSSYRRF